jgi:hypothetical protein
MMTPRSGTRGLLRGAGSALVVSLWLVLCVVATSDAPAAGAAPKGPHGIEWSTTTVDGERVSRLAGQEPLKLDSARPTVVALALTNTSKKPVGVTYVRLTGTVMGMTFFNYSTEIHAILQPHEVLRRNIRLDLYDLTDQAVGRIPARLELLGSDRKVLDGYAFAVDVQGSLSSVYGVFGLAVAGMTIVLAASLLFAIVRRRLPQNRWQRAVRFLPVGVGTGLTLTFTFSATRQLTPSATAWGTLVLVMAAAAFTLGYVLPTGRDEDDDLADAEADAAVEKAAGTEVIPAQREDADLSISEWGHARRDQ